MFGQLGFVIKYLPKIIAVVMLVEDLLRPETSGADKKAMALEFLRVEGVPETYINIAGNLIDLVVSVLHALGILQRSKTEKEPAVLTEALSEPMAEVRREREEVHVTDEAFDGFLKATER